MGAPAYHKTLDCTGWSNSQMGADSINALHAACDNLRSAKDGSKDVNSLKDIGTYTNPDNKQTWVLAGADYNGQRSNCANAVDEIYSQCAGTGHGGQYFSNNYYGTGPDQYRIYRK